MRQIMLDGPAGPMAIWVEGDTGPLVICAHGWPELGYSWRRQSPAIRAAGFRFAAPDMRGYGGSARPPEVSAYRSSELARDVIAIADALGAARFVLIGHDWGAPVAYWTALAYPDRVAAIVGMSVPHTGRPPVSFDRIWEMRYPDSFFYMRYFQAEGVGEAELEADIPRSLRQIYGALSANAPRAGWLTHRPREARLLDGTPDRGLPSWLSAEELAVYVAGFQQSGFRGPLNWYRNFPGNWAESDGVDQVLRQPFAFIAGADDAVLRFADGMLDLQRSLAADLRAEMILPGVGHWVQQEAADKVNDLLAQFLPQVRDLL